VGKKGGKSLFSLSTLLASFFGAAMIAASFAYFNYKFSEYKFINFSEWTFYEKSALFSPHEEKYIIVFYSSREQNTMNLLATMNLGIPILAIDYYNRVRENTDSTIFFKKWYKNFTLFYSEI
jgi:hypothetical protein